MPTLPAYVGTVSTQDGQAFRVRSSECCASPSMEISVHVVPFGLWLSANDARALGEHLIAAADHYRRVTERAGSSGRAAGER